MALQVQLSERRLATTLQDDYEANWNRGRDDGQDHILSQADTLTKKVVFKSKSQRKVGNKLGLNCAKIRASLNLLIISLYSLIE